MPTLNWIGKDKVITHHQDVPFHVLEHRYGFSSNGQSTIPTELGNKIIHGDNLIALKSLLPQYEGKIDCIYIDPPYNTGNEDWKYNDNVSDPRLLKWLKENVSVGKEGEDLTRHDKWLCMMFPRLQLMQKLLSNDGAIFISIDKNEFANLKYICDYIFTNFVGCISWQRTYAPRNDSKGIVSETEYIMVYSKSQGWQPNRLERTDEMDAKYKNPDNDWCAWTSSDAFAAGASSHQGMVYGVQHPFTGEVFYPYKDGHWRTEQQEILRIMNQWCPYELKELDDAKERAAVCGISEKEVRQGVCAIILKETLEKSRELAQQVLERGQWPKLYFTSNGKGGIRRKSYIEQMEGRIVTNLWPYSEVGHTDEAKKELKDIFGGAIPFDTPKPLRLIERILHIATKPNSIVLDAFAGSGTTGHAVLRQNQKDGGHRKFVLIEMMDFAEDTTAERIRHAITGYTTKQKHEVELYNKKLTIANLKNATTYLDEAKRIIVQNECNYEEISKPKIVDNSIKVIASKVTNGKVAGIEASFDYYEIGNPLFDSDGNINPDIYIEKIRQYVFFSETRQQIPEDTNKNSEYYLGTHDGVAYYFYYERDAETTLSKSTLGSIVKEKAEQYIIYANCCTLSKETLAKLNITFKKISKDIQKF